MTSAATLATVAAGVVVVLTAVGALAVWLVRRLMGFGVWLAAISAQTVATKELAGEIRQLRLDLTREREIREAQVARNAEAIARLQKEGPPG